ncbi:MAG: hypothetical protein ABI550_03940 [Ignavibacteriaceae bacterium]
MSNKIFHSSTTGNTEELQEQKIVAWYHDDQVNEPTGFTGYDGYIFKIQEKSKSGLIFRQANDVVEVDNSLSVKQNIFEGQVEKIFDAYALVVFDINNNFVERKISLKRLSQINAEFEGANISLVIFEKNDGTIISKIEKTSDEPYDSHPDEDLIHIIDRLKKHSS